MIAVSLYCRRTLLMSIAGIGGAIAADLGVRFDSPGVLDLAQRTTIEHVSGTAVTFSPSDSPDIRAIVDSPAISDERSRAFSFSQDDFGCTDGDSCMSKGEVQRIVQSNGNVRRVGERLLVDTGADRSAVFVDWNKAETADAEGDSEAHWYLGRMAGSGYHRVEVQFGHDAPGNFLINPKNGKIAFVHSAADVVALSADGRTLFTFNALNSPLSVRVARLDATGPRLVLVCSVRDDDRNSRAEFKGWRGNGAFDLVVRTTDGAENQSTALRFARHASTWTATTSDLAALSRSGLACKSL